MISKATIRKFRIVQKEMSADMSMNTTTENSTEKTNQEIPLNEFITLQRGFDLPSRERVEGDIPVVASTGISSFHNIAKIKAPGVVIGRSGSIGGGQYITEDFWPLNTTLWVKDFKHHHPRFIYYLLKSIDFTSFNAGAAVPTLNRNHLSSIKIKPFTYEHEEQIAKVLGDLDDKIQLNQQINQTLEEMAQALFKSWFVDFEPTKAKIAAFAAGGNEEDANLAAMQAISGKTATELEQLKTQNPENYQQLYTTAQHFPAAMQESELGEIPEGWEVSPIENILERLRVKKRYTKKQVSTDGAVPVLEQGANILLGYHDDEPSLNATVEEPVFIFGDHTCITHLSCSPFDVSQNVIPLKGSGFPTLWTYYAIQGKQEFQEYRRHWAELIVKQVVLPKEALSDIYAKKVMPLVHKKEQLERENRTLSSIRDELLPKLLSGELSVENIEIQAP